MFTRSIVIQRHVEDLQVGVESYQKKLNLTKPDTYRSDLKRREAYTAYSNPRGFIYQNKEKKNRLMRIDELYKFSDGTLNDVCNALDDHLKGIRMQYLPQTIWRKDPVLEVSLAGKTIQDAKKFEQLVDLLHMFQTPNVRVRPSDRPTYTSVAGLDGVLADSGSPPSLRLFDPRSDPAEGPS
nr:hypothetical protein [Tanacetum cinerariifolium]